MGTRNLTVVLSEGQVKVAQYGQWDGYPDGQGVTILKFLSDAKNITSIKESLKKVRFLDSEGKDKEWVESYDKNAPEWSNEPDNRTELQKTWYKSLISRDVAGEILQNITQWEGDEVVLDDSISFGKDTSFCEWAYVVDLDNNLFEVHKEGWSSFEERIPVKKYWLGGLPSKDAFISAFTEEE